MANGKSPSAAAAEYIVQTALLLWSPPGCGKSAAGEQFADRTGRKFYSFVPGQEDPVDTCGVITLDEKTGTSSRKLPLWWQNACREPYVVLVDELTTCGPEQYAAALRATDDSRSLCGAKLHPGTIIIAAANPPEMAAGSARELPPPVLSRFRHRRITAAAAVDWMNGGKGIVLDLPVKPPVKQMRAVVAAYLKTNSTAPLADPKTIADAVAKQEPFPCPRAWWRAACEEGDLSSYGEYVGTAAAGAFINWFTKLDLPDPQEILDGKESTVPSRGDCVMVTAGSMAALLGKTPPDKYLANFMRWVKLAAEAGHAANAQGAVCTAIVACGHARLSRYPKELEPFSRMLQNAGLLRA